MANRCRPKPAPNRRARPAPRTPLAPPDEPPLQLCAATRTEPATVALERSFARWRADCARNGAPDALWRSVCAAVGG